VVRPGLWEIVPHRSAGGQLQLSRVTRVRGDSSAWGGSQRGGQIFVCAYAQRPPSPDRQPESSFSDSRGDPCGDPGAQKRLFTLTAAVVGYIRQMWGSSGEGDSGREQTLSAVNVRV